MMSGTSHAAPNDTKAISTGTAGKTHIEAIKTKSNNGKV